MSLEKISQVGDMPVYQSFLQLAVQVEKLTRDFSPDFRWLRVQCLRSSESVCANMAEGFYAQYTTEYMQSLYRCRREARETMSHMEYAVLVGRISEEVGEGLARGYRQALIQLAHVTRSVEAKLAQRGKSKELPSQLRESGSPYSVQSDDEWIDPQQDQIFDDPPTI